MAYWASCAVFRTSSFGCGGHRLGDFGRLLTRLRPIQLCSQILTALHVWLCYAHAPSASCRIYAMPVVSADDRRVSRAGKKTLVKLCGTFEPFALVRRPLCKPVAIELHQKWEEDNAI